MSWYDGAGTELTQNVENSQELLSDGKRFTVKSTLKLQAQSEHHNTVLTCRAKSAAETLVKSAEIKVEVNIGVSSQWLLMLGVCVCAYFGTTSSSSSLLLL